MEYLSTTSLASDLNLPTSELFTKLKNLGWIDRKNEKWVLTDLGKQKGGQTRTNPKFGEFIVWPENISVTNEQQVPRDKPKLISATTIGKQFNVSSQRINLILSELGFIEKDIAGWEITKLGKSLGGRQFEHETSGNSYVTWPETIVQNKRLLEFFKEPQIERVTEIQATTHLSPTTNAILTPSVYHDTFREKFPAPQRTYDGHYVRSKSEALIDNFLYINGIVHAYERKLPIEEEVYCDFYIPSGNGRPQVYIEFWGLENDSKYLDRKKKKIEIYRKYEFPLIELNEPEINNLEEILTRKLIQHKISVR